MNHPCQAAAPARVEDTDAFFDDEDGARKLWDDGFRPRHAHRLEPGLVVAYRVTFFDSPFGEVETGLVGDVQLDDVTVVVSHTGGTTEVDECDEVWAREAKVWEA